MKEYALYRRINGGQPFISSTFKNYNDMLSHLYNFTSRLEEDNYVYYVDNDFYENKYPFMPGHCDYIKVIFREVDVWKTVAKDDNKQFIVSI